MLHGEIKVNDKEIWFWQAVRQMPAEFVSEKWGPMYRYKWYANNLETGEEYEDELTHYYIEGATTLVIRIMEELEDKLREEIQNKERTK